MAEYLKLEFIKVSESRAVLLSSRTRATPRFCFTRRPGAWKMLSQWPVILGSGGLFKSVLPGSDLVPWNDSLYERGIYLFVV